MKESSLGRAKQFKGICERTEEELKKTSCWDFKKLKRLRTRLRWANFHYKENMKTYEKLKQDDLQEQQN